MIEIAFDVDAYLPGEEFREAGSIPVLTEAEQVTPEFCLKFLRGVRDCVFATVDVNGLPEARVIDVMMVGMDPLCLCLLTPRGKVFHEELCRTGFAAIVGQTTDWRTCRFRGKVVKVEDEQDNKRLVDAMFELNPAMKELYPGDSRDIIDAFYIEDGEGEFFDLGQKPLLRAAFKIGSGVTEDEAHSSYRITDECKMCSTCAKHCPVSCIEEGDPYKIEQSHCLKCGLCYEVCPFDAIERR
ncbi:4Fe-4S binding protein [Adlercreutzia agrestimuris]|uniref:4Fe-4S binding protein n=1 Tax=Adlercreutzia agrestimuris TaxID=2941324 RepID=UPI0020426756|nr:4Fe-4S binding protein [Adlercreutzia agrestimuris]